MGKSKRRKLEEKRGAPKARPATKPHGISKPTRPKSKSQQHKTQEPTIPFAPEDRILLIGEGDFSFAHSLLTHHGCTSLLATCYDSRVALLEKYAQAEGYITELLEEGQEVLYEVNATKLGQKEIRKGQRWDRIVFNFPHVGGKSTDVNRQVRYNQELLVNFFRTATPLLAPSGIIIVTLFEGEPYTLWNIRDLARHAGLTVERSFKFQSEAYPGYKHARTLGNIEGGGGWKGETRLARSYEFMAEMKDTRVGPRMHPDRMNRKRKRDESSDEDD
ncbi:hypothetical protein LTR66_003161 [Elasticomyces elasticus]|nr:hypothetical protein LTR66_003161 [Elasticomyces elasticus]